ncbi:MAG: PIN domain-containing protein [Cyanobium sp.]
MAAPLLLDPSALLTLRDDETGAARLERALEQPQRFHNCFLTCMEVLYRVWKDEDERACRLAYEQLKALPLLWIEASEPLLDLAASTKARDALSVADAWIAAAAQQVGATLLHKDPAFRAMADLSQEWLC